MFPLSNHFHRAVFQLEHDDFEIRWGTSGGTAAVKEEEI
jgi:hypothetical protein